MEAEKVIEGLQVELRERIKDGAGPFLAAVCRPDGTVVAKAANSVVLDSCSHCHAEMNAIKAAEKALGTYDLSNFDLSLYVTAEPCVMCMGAIMWSGIRHVYYGVSSKRVEEITGFDEGYKPDWEKAFAERGISVAGGFARELGEQVLREYVESGHKIYKPGRGFMKYAVLVALALPVMTSCARVAGDCARAPGDPALSGIAYAGNGEYWAADDDGAIVKGAIEIDASSGKPVSWRRIEKFGCAGIKDPEGVVLDKLDGTLWVADEHKSRIWHVDPKTKEVLGRVQVPVVYKAIEDNRGFESLAIGNDGLTLWAANEGPLTCDEGTDYVRLQRFVRASVTNEWTASGQYVYRLEHCLEGKHKAKSRNGLSELCVAPDGTLLVLEREKFKKGRPKFRMRIFKVDVSGATDVSAVDSLKAAAFTPVKKSVVCEMATGDAMYEAICVGPKLADGSCSYVLVSDGDKDCEEKVMVLALP